MPTRSVNAATMRGAGMLRNAAGASAAANTAAMGTSRSVAAADLAANAMQAVLFSEILKPLSAALGPVGDVALAAVTQGLFVRARP